MSDDGDREAGERPAPQKGRYRKFRLLEAVDRVRRGATYSDLEAIYGVPRSTLHKRLEGVFRLLDPDTQSAYRERRIDLLEGAELEFLDAALDPAKIEKASTRDLMIAFGITSDKRRLESGLSTSNIALHSLVEEIERQQRRSRTLPSGNGEGNGAPK